MKFNNLLWLTTFILLICGATVVGAFFWTMLMVIVNLGVDYFMPVHRLTPQQPPVSVEVPSVGSSGPRYL